MSEQIAFRCPGCGACRWSADMTSAGMTITCYACGWSDLVAAIEERIIGVRPGGAR